jgi:ABC-type transport system involved in multi-copper enzyme maturation permease subunit
MLGPVLYLEMLLGSRRGKQYIFRFIYAGWIVLMLLGADFAYFIHITTRADDLQPPFGETFLSVLLIQHFFLLILTTPAFVAGAITDEKSQGTLQYLMTADLTPSEIVLGKLFGRVGQVVLLAMVGLPAIAFCGAFAGLDPFRAFALACYSALVLFAVGSASMLASVLTKTTREAVLGLYSVGIALIIVYGIVAWLTDVTGEWGPVVALVGFMDTYIKGYLSPFYIPDHVWKISNTAAFAHEMLMAILIWGGFGATCIGLSIVLLRRAYIRQLEGEGKKKKPHWWRARRTAVSDDPVRWKERQVEGIAPFAFLRSIPTPLGVLAVFLLTCISSALIIEYHMPDGVTLKSLYQSLMAADGRKLSTMLGQIDPASTAFRAQAMAVMLLASFIVAIRCSGAVSGERERHTWEALLLTPLDTRHLIRGKLWGIIGASHPYLIAYAVPAILFSILGGPMAVFWTCSWLATTWLAMYYVGAAGVWCSTRSKSSWRSLVGTLGFCYVGGFFIYGPLMLIIAIAAWFVLLFLVLIDSMLNVGAANNFATFLGYYGTAFYFCMCLALAGVFFGLAKFFLHDAEKRVGALERTRHWEYDPDQPRRRRRLPAKPGVAR